MPEFLNPENVSRPASRFSQGVVHGPVHKRLLISGQVGARADGVVVDGLAAQTELVFDNIEAVLARAEMTLAHLVKLTIFCVAPGDPGLVREIRNRRLGSHAPASTVVLVAGLANPAYLIEIEGEAIEEA